ncbi:hypothetical protein JW872_02295 [Candidatus Babeliales bacterium]|nr:hypothetical protein [Candidatus Babeliales bacterium]
MNTEACQLRFSFQKSHPKFCTVNITVPAPFIERLYAETSRAQKHYTQAHGFAHGKAPTSYIAKTFHSPITHQVQEFMLNYMVRTHLIEAMRSEKIIYTGDPKLTNVELEPGKDAQFTFECTIPEELALKGWKFYPFKAPKRKNYRDLDRQVQLFIKNEDDVILRDDEPISIRDWVCFDIAVTDHTQCSLFDAYHQTMWLKIGNEEIDKPFQKLFCGKQNGDTFYTSAECFQEYFSSQLDTHYTFGITILDVVHDIKFSLNDFKTYFRLRTHKEIHKKLIEVFSYRNDVSQRREMTEEAFKVLFKHHKFEVPQHILLRQQQELLEIMHRTPDYQVYRTQKGFEETIKKLSEKQMKEMILIDQLALKESITINRNDVRQYLNLLKRARTREFLHFGVPVTRINGMQTPLSESALGNFCLREKTVNHVIFHLTRR